MGSHANVLSFINMKSLKNIVSVITAVTSLIGIIVIASNFDSSILMSAVITIAVLGFISAIFLWKEKRWAAWAIFFYFLLQIISIQSAAVGYFFWVGFKFYINLRFDDVIVGINIFAIVMTVLTINLLRNRTKVLTQR